MLPLQVKGVQGGNGNEGLLHIPKIFKAVALLSDGLMLYPGHSLGSLFPL